MASFVRTSIFQRGEPIEIVVNGRRVPAYEGESLAAALLVTDELITDHWQLFCGMGACFDCLVTVDGVPNVRACATVVRKGIVVRSE